MMHPFLETMAIHLIGSHGGDLADCCLVLPNRRSGLFLRHHLAAQSRQVMWEPRIYAISDFIDELSVLELPDPVELQLILYDIYRDCVDRPESFDDFYFWGEMMLNDFDDLDTYRVDVDMIFRNIMDLKELEEPMAGLEEEQFRLIRRFWSGFHEGSPSPEKEKFSGLWKLLPVLYHRLRDTLTRRGLGTHGMQYREIADRIEHDEVDWQGGNSVIVVGFNALNSCEKRIFSWLRGKGAQFFWDYDTGYVKDDTREAGRFLREDLRLLPETAKLEAFNSLKEQKDIRILELPSDVLQAKTVHKILEMEGEGTATECTDTAVVLCDEDLLMPLVMSLPQGYDKINVTMGYPLSRAPIFSFTDLLIALQHNIRKGSGGTARFYHKDVASILSHPCVIRTESETIPILLREITVGNMMFVDETLFRGELERKIFRRMDEGAGFIGYFRRIYQHLLDIQAEREDRMHQDLDREFIFQILVQLNKLEMLVRSRPELSRDTLVRLFRKILSTLRVPFEGEPLSGLQVMGILETRLLDFRHVILLSMNEEVMPRPHPGHSFIPYALRAGYRMPVREDMDAIYAYYFYRLIQRAEKVDLLFNSRAEGVKSGEMSRYLIQLIYERGISVIRPGLEVRAREIRPLVINHSEKPDMLLDQYLEGAGEGKYLSPSAVNTYIDCPLKFYLRFIAGIGEPDEVLEEMDAAGFGTVVHESIRRLYDDALQHDGTITPGKLVSLLHSGKPEEVLEHAFLEHHFRGDRRARIEGRNIIIFRVMLKYLEKILETDLKIAPFRLVSSERKYTRTLPVRTGKGISHVLLGGKIDRVDLVGEQLRVIDYKTGNARKRFNSVDNLFDAGSPGRNGAVLQVLFYAWMVSGQHPGKRITPGLYIMRELYGEDFNPGLIPGTPSGAVPLDTFQSLEDEFVSRLREVVEQMFDPGIPYTQTAVESRCRQCDFAGLCNRYPDE